MEAPLVIYTLRKVHNAGYQLCADCPNCNHYAFLYLPQLLAAGHGERKLLGLRVRCSRCQHRGTRPHDLMIWPGNRQPNRHAETRS
jgi:hypothetical protein